MSTSDDLYDSIAAKEDGETAAPEPAAEPAAPEPAAPEAKKKAPAKPKATPAAKAAPAKAALVPSRETSAATGAAPRRGPGRPPTRPKHPRLEMHGIVAAPDDVDCRVEFAYHDPSVFKSLFTYFKKIKAKVVFMRFDPLGITMFTRDDTRTSRNIARIAGSHANWYYCRAETWLGLSRATVEKMFSSIDRNFSKISISYRDDDETSLIFVLKNFELEKEVNYKFKVTPAPPLDEELIAAERALTPEVLGAAPLRFTLTDRSFKKSVSDIANYSRDMTIEKTGDSPLRFTFTGKDLSFDEVYRDAKKIALKSRVAKGASFHCRLKVASLKFLAEAMVAKSVRFFVFEDRDLIVRSTITGENAEGAAAAAAPDEDEDKDKALVVSTLVSL